MKSYVSCTNFSYLSTFTFKILFLAYHLFQVQVCDIDCPHPSLPKPCYKKMPIKINIPPSNLVLCEKGGNLQYKTSLNVLTKQCSLP